MASSLVFDILGIILGLVGAIGLFPIVQSFIRCRLPTQKFKELDDTLTETYSLLHSVEEEGLLPNPAWAEEVKRRLAGYRRQTEEYRSTVYCATTCKGQLALWFQGVSRKISEKNTDVMEVRATIMSTSQKERERREVINEEENLQFRRISSPVQIPHIASPPKTHVSLKAAAIFDTRRYTPGGSAMPGEQLVAQHLPFDNSHHDAYATEPQRLPKSLETVSPMIPLVATQATQAPPRSDSVSSYQRSSVGSTTAIEDMESRLESRMQRLEEGVHKVLLLMDDIRNHRCAGDSQRDSQRDTLPLPVMSS
ncbi:hypothetical protein K474DRAFT_1707016 [Panus rudis PR-1116 ss-1]|nr:hypothetical protein K474DRAFT_1707016 [Panus rudis PR-1116 ss-1]